MELLITLIGNAAANSNFRQKFLDNPEQTVKRYGFRMTKSDHEMMMSMFGNLTPVEKQEYEQAFLVLENKMYLKVPCTRPCRLSIYDSEDSGVLSTAA